jgi:serine/threonine protein kinase/WD40 repeat protein
MASDRQTRIDALVHSALTIDPRERASFLCEVCQDADVREEVTQTLYRLAAMESPETGTPVVLPESRAIDPDKRSGQMYGVYQVLRRIGSGGMGEVYLATDTRLERQIALKFLSARTTTDELNLRRFQFEARTASALNHPNILTIFDVGKFGGEHYIASEFVEGVTLRTRLKSGPMDVTEAVEIVTQIASALVAAHSAGVIHRDLKPTNIMIRPDGYVKVIDFGLAKSIFGNSEMSRGEAFTRPGTMVGTVDYMSPEQASGDAADPRTDIWSLGVLFYEMLTGRRPFEGRTEYHVIVQILEGAPAPIALPGVLPAAVEEVIHRCLQKDRGQRYTTSAELVAGLREARRALNLPSSSRHAAGIQMPSFSRRPLWIGLTLLAVIAALAGWWWETRGREYLFGPEPFDISEVRQVTYNGQTSLAAISPDGTYLAYVTGPQHHSAVWVKRIDSPNEALRLPASDVEYQGLTFSNDSQEIYFVSRSNEYGKLFRLPVTGGEPQLTAVDVDGPAAIDPAGGAIAFVRNARNVRGLPTLIVRNGALELPVHAISGMVGRRLAWSPSHRTIAAFLYPPADGHTPFTLNIVKPASDKLMRSVAVPGWRATSQPVWMSNGYDLIVPSALETETNEQLQLREVSTLTGRTRDVTNDIYGYKGASLTADGNQLLTVRVDRRTTFWIGPRSDLRNGRSISGDSGRYETVSWTDDGKLVAQANRGNGVHIWEIDPAHGRPTRLTAGASTDRNPVWIPHQKSVIFVSDRDGSPGLWKFDPETESYSLLARDPGYIESPACLPDGKSVIYTGWSNNEPSIWMASTTAGTSGTKLLIRGARHAVISPDGSRLAVEIVDKAGARGWRVAIYNLNTQTLIEDLPNIPPGSKTQWYPDGQGLNYVITDDQGTSNIWLQPLNGAPAKPVTYFQESEIFDYNWSPDGRNLLCLRGRTWSDAYLLIRKKP